MQWEVTIPPQIAALKLHRGSPDSHREEWLTRKYQQMLFVAAAKGHVQIKIDKADHAIVRKSGVKKHLWLEGWAFIKDDRLEVYTDYPPKVCGFNVHFNMSYHPLTSFMSSRT